LQDWKRTFHDTLGLPSCDLNFYRDLFLLAPVMLFAITGSVHLFGAANDKMLAWKCLAIAAYGVLLARERVLLILGGLAFCAVSFLLGFAFTQNWRLLVGVLATGLPVLLALRFARKYKPSYSWPANLDAVATFVVSVCSLLFTLKGFQILDTKPF
jgi:hypothetical protein